jgi:Tol biopolymer transport system component
VSRLAGGVLLSLGLVSAAGSQIGARSGIADAFATVETRLAARNVTSTPEHNEWNPRFSPEGRHLSYERRDGSAQAIFVADLSAPDSPPERVSSMRLAGPATPEEVILGAGGADESFNAQLSFFPDGARYVFTGNEASGVYRLYEGRLRGGAPQALTFQSKEDGHPAVSPDGRWLAYVSARQGIGKLVLRELATGEERPLTTGDKMDLFPAWSPDSRSIAYTSGDNDNHDVFLIPDVGAPSAPLQLTRWAFDDLRPIFSPDGRAIAFYSSYNPENEDKVWSIVVVPADGSGPSKGAALAQRAAAVNVVKDPEVGPAWLPGGRLIAYARNIKAEFNPIYVVDTESGEERRIETSTRMNHDLTCSESGLLAFRAQVASWDDIFVAPLARVR